MKQNFRAHGAKRVTTVLLLAGGLSLASGFLQPASAASPFGQLVGSWGGSGQIKLRDGRSERINCNAYYSGGGSQLRMAVRCKGDTNSIEMRSTLSYSNGDLSGSWEERVFNLDGTASGSVAGNKLRLSISGGVSGSMSVSFGPSHQDVSISTSGVPLKSVSISLSRR